LFEEMVEILKPFEEITRHVCGAKYPTMNLLKKVNPLDLIYGPLSDFEKIADSDTSVSSDDEADISSAGKELDNSDIVRYLPSANCDGLLERMRLPRKLKLLSFATSIERRNIENQICKELLLLKPNRNNSDTERTQTTIEEDCDSLSTKLWGPHSTPVLQTAAEDELTNVVFKISKETGAGTQLADIQDFIKFKAECLKLAAKNGWLQLKPPTHPLFSHTKTSKKLYFSSSQVLQLLLQVLSLQSQAQLLPTLLSSLQALLSSFSVALLSLSQQAPLVLLLQAPYVLLLQNNWAYRSSQISVKNLARLPDNALKLCGVDTISV
ncbi:25494_t:CDS:2, partial [Dentiscutata erythropus]